MRIVIFGATGMVGSGALLECLDDRRVHEVLVVGRRPCGMRHPKLTELLHDDFFSYESVAHRFVGCDACFFCLGVSAMGMSEVAYRRMTFELTLAAARAMVAASPQMTFCYVSGEGTDSTERGRIMWARVKGETENALLRMSFRAAYMLRPGFILPLRGVRSKTRLYQTAYSLLRPLHPLLRRLPSRLITTSVNVGRALIQLAAGGYSRQILHNGDINLLAGTNGAAAG